MIYMGTLILDEKMSYPITMKGMVICYDGILSKEELQERSKIEIRPINNGPYMSVITRPRVINYENKDGKTYFKLVSGSNENADATRVNEVVENSPEVKLLKTVAQIAAQTFTDEQAIMVKNIYDVWAPNVEYTKDTFFTYDGELYTENFIR